MTDDPADLLPPEARALVLYYLDAGPPWEGPRKLEAEFSKPLEFVWCEWLC